MGEQERLSPEMVAQPTLLAAEHVHRYRFAAELCRGARVLDLGCGTGYGSRILRAETASVTGIDSDVIGLRLLGGRVEVHELTPLQESLEGIFMGLTQDAVQYQSHDARPSTPERRAA